MRWAADKNYLAVDWYLFGKWNNDTVAIDEFEKEKKWRANRKEAMIRSKRTGMDR